MKVLKVFGDRGCSLQS